MIKLREEDIQAIAQAIAEKVAEIIEGNKVNKEAEEEKERLRRELEFEARQAELEPKVIRMGGINK